MKCPHCKVTFHDNATTVSLGICDEKGSWIVAYQYCPECESVIIDLVTSSANYVFGPINKVTQELNRFLAYPKSTHRPVPKEVPETYAEDFTEACLVLSDSPKASAALSRRCLQAVLRDCAKTKSKDLADQIEEVFASGKFPPYLTQSLDVVRNIGNFAAHAIKSRVTGEIVPVEPGEAEWSLDTLEAVFDFFFVQPAIVASKHAALNAKLKDVGKPPAKK